MNKLQNLDENFVEDPIYFSSVKSKERSTTKDLHRSQNVHKELHELNGSKYYDITFTMTSFSLQMISNEGFPIVILNEKHSQNAIINSL